MEVLLGEHQGFRLSIIDKKDFKLFSSKENRSIIFSPASKFFTRLREYCNSTEEKSIISYEQTVSKYLD